MQHQLPYHAQQQPVLLQQPERSRETVQLLQQPTPLGLMPIQQHPQMLQVTPILPLGLPALPLITNAPKQQHPPKRTPNLLPKPSDDAPAHQNPPPKHRKPPPTCPKCSKEFHSAFNLSVHLREIHGGGRGKHACTQCGMVFSRLRSLERHRNRLHLAGGGPRCKLCGGKEVVNLAQHFKRFHCKTVAVQVGASTTEAAAKKRSQ